VFFAGAMARALGTPAVRAVADAAQKRLPVALIVAAALGALSQLIHVRPDTPVTVPTPRHRRSGVRRPRPRRRAEPGGRGSGRRRTARR
jgi:hypothetical protein